MNTTRFARIRMLTATLAAAAMAGTALPVAAQTQAPGLWEHSMTMKSQNGEMDRAMAAMQKSLASMSPEQRAQVEAAMSRNNVKLGPQGNSVQVCISKEEAAKPPEARMQRGDCSSVDVTRSGNKMSYKFECQRPPSKGEGEMTFISDKAYTGHVTVDAQVGGKPQQMTMEMSGKWLSSDCGDVKPRAMPAPPK